LRSKIDDLDEQIVYVPIVSNNPPDFDYNKTNYDNMQTTFAAYKYKRVGATTNTFQLEGVSAIKDEKKDKKSSETPVDDEPIENEPPPKKRCNTTKDSLLNVMQAKCNNLFSDSDLDTSSDNETETETESSCSENLSCCSDLCSDTHEFW